MQQNHSGRRFSETAPQQPVYRFPQNQPMQGWQPQQNFPAVPQHEEVHLSRKDRMALNRCHRKHRKIFTLWNLFAVIGLLTTIVQLTRYILIPMLVYLNVLAGGVQ